MEFKLSKNTLKTIISIVVVLALVLSFGCDLLPFGKKDPAVEAAKLQNETNKIFTTAQKNAKDFDAFLTKLKKRWYSAKDVADFASSISTFKTKISGDLTSLKQVKSKLTSLTALDEEKKFAEYVQSKTKASVSLTKALQDSRAILTKLDPGIVKIAQLYTKVDEVKQAQSQYAAALGVNSKRIVDANLIRALREVIITASGSDDSGGDTGGETGGDTGEDTGSGDGGEAETSTTIPVIDETSDTSIAQPIEPNKPVEIGDGTTSDSGGTVSISATSSSSEELDPWVYQITKNEWPTQFMRDAVKEISDKFSSMYESTYALHKEINFQNSRKLVKYLQEINTDSADYLASINAIIDNLKETKRLEKLKEKKTATLNSIKATKAVLESSLNKRPSGVSAESLAKRGIDQGIEITETEIKRYESDIEDADARLKTLADSLAGSLETDYEEAIWRTGGSLIALYKLNLGVSRSLMHETKSWKRKAISKLVLNRAEQLAEAKYQDYKAKKAYAKLKDKVASR